MKINPNKFEVIIQAGGRGSRLRHYTWNKPKCLVSYYGKPTIFHTFEYLPNSNFHIIGDYQVDKIKKYFLISPPKVNFKVYKTNKIGTCAGIKDVINNIDKNKEILLIWSDLIINKLPSFNYNQTVVTTSSFTCRWSFKNNKLVEETSSKNGVPGIFFFRNKKILKNIKSSGEFVKWYSKNIKTFKTEELNPLKELGDFSTIEDSYNKIGYGRFFNKITINKNYVIKKSIDKNFSHLIKKEQNWYSEVAKLKYNDIPRIYSNRPFKIEKINGNHLFEYKNLNRIKTNKILENVFDSLENLHNKYMETSIKKDIEEVYINKTLKRLNSVSKIIPNFSSAKSFTINGKKCKNYLYPKNRGIFKEILKILLIEKFRPIHGDPTLSNILIKNNLRPIFIDPRGYFANTKSILGDKNYDISKIYYSVIGNYDLFNRRKFKLYVDSCSIEILMDNIYPKNSADIFKSHFSKDLKRIEIIHSLIWLSLSGYVKDDIDSIIASFYNGIYWLNRALE